MSPRAPGRHRGRQVSMAEFRALWMDFRLTEAEIGRRLGISQQAVQLRAKARGLPSRAKNRLMQRKIGAAEEAGLRRLWLAGVASGAIRAHLGVSKETMLAAVRRIGLPPRGRQWRAVTTLEQALAGCGRIGPFGDARRHARDEGEVRRLWEAGLSYADIGVLMGCSRQAAHQWCYRRGWVRSRNHRPAMTLAEWRERQMAERLAEVAARETALEQALRMGRKVAA